MPNSDPKIREELIRSIRRLTFWTITLFISLALISTIGLVDSRRQAERIEDVAYNNRNAMCQFRFDLERRYENSIEFLKDNPEGIPGLPVATLRRSLEGQKATLDALSSLQCRDIAANSGGDE